MNAKHMLKYHLGLPVVLFAALLLFGVPLAAALPVAAMSGCLAMVLMVASAGRGSRDDQHEQRHT